MYRFWFLAGGAGLISAAAFLTGVIAGLGGSYSGFMLVYLSPAPLFAAALGLAGPPVSLRLLPGLFRWH